MAKLKVKKHSTFVDMTAMSDVTVLLLTFFMMTSTFIQKEPVTVTTPSSVSETTIPETDIMTVLVDSEGKIFMSLDNVYNKEEALVKVGEDYGIEFTPQQIQMFKSLQSFGVPIRYMQTFLSMTTEAQDEFLKNLTDPRVGIPTLDVEVLDASGTLVSGDNEFKRWVTHAMTINPKLKIAIKADQSTGYPVVKTVMDNLRAMKQNRYLLITNLKATPAEE